MPVPTVRAVGPRFGPDSIFYLSSKGGADGIWKFTNGSSTELWSGSSGGVTIGPAVSADGRQVCFTFRSQGRGRLYCMTADGTDARPLAASLDVSGGASWSPEGKRLAVAADEGDGIRVFKVPVDGGLPVRLVDQQSSNPEWFPDGRFILYATAQVSASIRLGPLPQKGNHTDVLHLCRAGWSSPLRFQTAAVYTASPNS